MFFSSEDLSEREKIDSIYKMLRSEQRGRRFGLFIKLLLLGGIIYGYYYLSLPSHADIRKDITNTIQTRIMEIVLPLVSNMVQDLTQNMGIPGQFNMPEIETTTSTPNKKRNTPSNGTSPINITPEMIKAVQDSIQQK